MGGQSPHPRLWTGVDPRPGLPRPSPGDLLQTPPLIAANPWEGVPRGRAAALTGALVDFRTEVRLGADQRVDVAKPVVAMLQKLR